MKFLTDNNLKNFWEWYLLPETTEKENVSHLLLICANTLPIKDRFNSLSNNERLGVFLSYYREEHNLILVPDYDVNLKKYFHWIIKDGETMRGQSLEKFDSYESSVEIMLIKADNLINEISCGNEKDSVV